MPSLDRLIHALQRCETDHAPDPRVTVFEVTPSVGREAVVLSGTVLTDHLKTRAVEAVEAVADVPVAATDVTVLEDEECPRTVTASVAPVRADPDDDAEQVTQVLYGASISAYDAEGDWRRVRTPDGYVAWVERTHLCEPTAIDPDAVVTAGAVTDGSKQTVYAGTECEILESDESPGDSVADSPDRSVRVRFRTGAERSLPADAVAEFPAEPTGESVVETARQYLGTEYVWGGMTVEGIDCSGLTWIAYHRHGVALPRDADLQRRMGESVARADLEPGDLLFFPGHVAVSLGGAEIVHAEGDAGEVVVDSLDPDADRYNERLDEGFELARRLV